MQAKMGAPKIICTLISVLTWLQTAHSQMLEMGPMDMMQLTSAVRQIVHPNARPSPAMLAIASRQGAPPSTAMQMLEYTPHFVNLATQMGVRPPGVKGTVTPQMMRDFMITKGNEWMTQQGYLAGISGGQMGLGSEMTGIGGLMGATGTGLTGAPSMRQPMATLAGSQQSTPGMGMGFSPMMMMMLNSGIESPALQLAMLNPQGNGGVGNPLNMMYFMENMA